MLKHKVELSRSTEAFFMKQCCLKERAQHSVECMILIFMKESQTFSRFKKNRNTVSMKINKKNQAKFHKKCTNKNPK